MTAKQKELTSKIESAENATNNELTIQRKFTKMFEKVSKEHNLLKILLFVSIGLTAGLIIYRIISGTWKKSTLKASTFAIRTNNAHTKNCKRACLPTQKKSVLKICQRFKKIKYTDTARQTQQKMTQKLNINKAYNDTVDRRPAGNRVLQKKRVQWLIEHSTSHQLLWYVDSLCSEIPLLRKAAKRYASF